MRIKRETVGSSLLLGSLSLFALPVLAWAQEAQDDPSRAMVGLEEILVTAQKRTESLQTVPISVSAVTGSDLVRDRVTRLSDLNGTMPNVQINSTANSPDSAVFTIRGVGVSDADPYVGTTVSVVVDGVVVGVNTAALLNTFDIDRIEVLRGPQGTLFGANTTGGVINVITKQPTGEFGISGNVAYGNYNRLDLGMAVDFPIVEDLLAGKISVFHVGHDGYFRNTVNGERLGEMDVTNMRGYVKYTPSLEFDATLIGEYTRTRNGSPTNINLSRPGHFFYVPGVTDQQGYNYTRGMGEEVGPDENHRDSYSATLTMNWDSPIGDVVSISNYREYDGHYYNDEDATAEPLFWQHRLFGQWQASQELRTSIQPTDSLNVIVGGFAMFQEYYLIQDLSLQGIVPGLGGFQTQDQKSRSLSAFAQAYLDITDKLRAQAGIRYSNEHVKALSTSSSRSHPSGFFEYNSPTVPGSEVVATGEKTWNKVGYKIGLDYQLDDDVMAYGYYARGFKSGGFVGRIVFPEDIGPFSPEHLDTFEIGLKSQFLDSRLRANLSLFHNSYKDMQVVQTIIIQSGPNIGQNSSIIANAGSAKTKGVELELTAIPVDDLRLSGSVAYLDAKYTDYQTLFNGMPVNFAGNRLQNAPKYSASITADYRIAVAGGYTDLNAQYAYTSSRYTNYTALPHERIRSYDLVNANVSWTPEDESWSVGVYGRNIFKEKYYTQTFDVVGLQQYASLGAPQEYGVNFRFNY